MSKTYITIATEQEFSLIRETGYFMPHETLPPIIVTGVGAFNVARALKDIPRDSHIINVGYAGSADIPIGTMVPIGFSKLFHPHVDYDDSISFVGSDILDGSVCYTSTDFVTESHEKGCVFDMELAFIIALGFHDVTAFKKVSDHCNYNQYEKTINHKDNV